LLIGILLVSMSVDTIHASTHSMSLTASRIRPCTNTTIISLQPVKLVELSLCTTAHIPDTITYYLSGQVLVYDLSMSVVKK